MGLTRRFPTHTKLPEPCNERCPDCPQSVVRVRFVPRGGVPPLWKEGRATPDRQAPRAKQARLHYFCEQCLRNWTGETWQNLPTKTV